ncbi:uncharacterized protein LOC125494904 [Beta vulgaris subsp. vulgaris]|uniref:uncharacterized protein LOC125494904 n=1 Tax=Beta vulgaris subsp. vulgaris TaxID=3555 RepID=UPI002036DC52|nr:uncharacterized protein LOC125494904 [Beta vulgaris subsp. vulgaris]
MTLNLPILISDHSPIFLHTSPSHERRRSPIKLEAWCLDFKEISHIITDIWHTQVDGSPMYRVAQKCRHIRYRLFKWCQEFKRSNNINWEECLDQCGEAQSNLLNLNGGAQDEKIVQSAREKLTLQVKFWNQRVKSKHRAWEDSNTKWFFRKAKSRKKRNQILMIKSAAGNWISDQKAIQMEMMKYFAQIYQGRHHGSDYWEELSTIRNLIPQLSEDQQNSLTKSVTFEEVKLVVFQMGSLKAPGPDGIPAQFYQQYWSTVGTDIWKAVSHFFSTGYILREWNYTNICLIPKTERPEEASQFRPISLCNVIYKIISKVISNRLKPILRELISPFQNAFVPGRQMVDNCLIAHELVNNIKQTTSGKQYLAALKIDMFKAYDKVDWDFLDWLLAQMRIPSKCRHWIMQCVTTVSYSIIVNGEPTSRFYPTCGLRQGDPLSSYLFILVMDVLSRMLTNGIADKSFEGIKISRLGPSVSHLFFADDSLIFFKANPKSCDGVKNIVSEFSRLSGEVINYHKSLIMFSPNTPHNSRQQMRALINTPVADSLGKYLGANIEVNGRNTRLYHPLVEKVEKKLSSWHNLSLSLAGRIILINSILSMLSLNILSTFLIPKTIANRLNSIFARFLWAGTSDKKPIYWKGKSTLELPKSSGGLGIRNVHLFNKALLAKQAVRIHNSSHSLIAHLAVQDCEGGFTKIIGDGSDTKILEDKWVTGEPIKLKTGIQLQERGIRTVKDLFVVNQKRWNSELIWKLFVPESSTRILTTYIPKEHIQDYYAWSESRHGDFRVKDAYVFLLGLRGGPQSNCSHRRFWSKLWASDLRPKWKIFIWRLLQNSLAVNCNLAKRNIPISVNCSICHQFPEDEKHLFRDCDTSSRIWSASVLGINTRSSVYIPLGDWIRNFLHLFWREDGLNSERVREFVTTLWSIWLYRNNIVFNNLTEHPMAIFQKKKILLEEFDESGKITRKQLKRGSIASDSYQPDSPLFRIVQSNVCSVLVDGAWKRHKLNYPRAGIGWTAYMNGYKIFEGNDKVLASSSLQAEALAVYRGLHEAYSKGFRNIQIHSDSAEVVRAVTSPHQPVEIATIIHDVRALAHRVPQWGITRVKRENLVVAHNLAIAARQGKLL